jgi:Cysteine-rich secretory protein family
MRGTWIVIAISLWAFSTPAFLPAKGNPDAQQIFELTNQARLDHGLQPLKWSDSLATAADVHARRVAQEPDLSHQYAGESGLAERAARAGVHFRAIAENIAVGDSAPMIEKGWMHSIPHRANILDPQMDTVGIAIIEGIGNLYAVADFARLSQPLSSDRIRQKVDDLLIAQGIDTSGPREDALLACRMEHGLPERVTARSIIRFETGDLSRLPDQVVRQLKSGPFTKAAFALCPPSLAGSAFTTYRFAVVLY